MSSIVDTSFLNFSFTNSISDKYTQVQKNRYIKSIQSQEDAANTRISALGKLLNSLMGFKFDTDDLISIDIGKINDAIISNLSSVTTALNSLAGELETTVNSYIDSIIPGQQDTYRTLINEYIKAEKTTYTSFNR